MGAFLIYLQETFCLKRWQSRATTYSTNLFSLHTQRYCNLQKVNICLYIKICFRLYGSQNFRVLSPSHSWMAIIKTSKAYVTVFFHLFVVFELSVSVRVLVRQPASLKVSDPSSTYVLETQHMFIPPPATKHSRRSNLILTVDDHSSTKCSPILSSVASHNLTQLALHDAASIT